MHYVLPRKRYQAYAIGKFKFGADKETYQSTECGIIALPAIQYTVATHHE